MKMGKKTKLVQRKQREQPQQVKMHPPPLLEERNIEEDDFERWKVLNMQYHALHRQDNEKKTGYANINKTRTRSANGPEKDVRNLTKPEAKGKKHEKIHPPALMIQSTQELLRQLPKGKTLYESAEIHVAKNNRIIESSEGLMREAVNDLHFTEVHHMETEFRETYDEICLNIAEIGRESQELEQKIRKFSLQANSESEEFEEINKHIEKVKDLEAQRDKLIEETALLEETTKLLREDISETAENHITQKEILNEEIKIYREKVIQIDNQRVESLEYECRELYKENQELEQDIERIEKNWKGDNKDIKKIIEEFDETSNFIKKELREITVSRAVVAQEREKIRKKTQELNEARIKFMKKSEKPEEKNPRSLYMYLDNLLTETSRKIRMVLQGNYDGSIENTVKDQLEKQFLQPENADPKIKSIKDCLIYLREKHDSNAPYHEKNSIKSMAEIIKKYKPIENTAISRSLAAIATLSPIRRVSPGRESSLSSLAKIRDITDKVIRRKRTPTNSSKSSIDMTEAEERKIQFQKYLLSKKIPN